MNYSVQGLLETFPWLFSQTDPSKADPDDYAGNPEKIANFVYANRNGNGSVNSGDGWKYRGRGIIQLSGKNNYEAYTNFYQDNFNSTKDFVQNPGLISSNSEIAVMSAMWFYKENVLDGLNVDENTTVDEITEIINGPGKNGLNDRKSKFKNVKNKIDNCKIN